MTTRLIWNKGAIAAVAVTSLACGGFVYAMGMGMSEPSAPVASAEKVELSTPAPTITALPVPSSTATPNWNDGYVPCDTPSGSTMTVGCYVDGDEPYIVTDDGETFPVDAAPVTEVTVPVVDERPPLPDGTLVCGQDAKPASDWNERDGWWAYCEPALIEPQPDVSLIPCEYEDSEDCYWDAANRGNGEGTSFVRIGGVTYYMGDTK